MPATVQDASPCSTAPRSPAPWASRCIWTSCTALHGLQGLSHRRSYGGRYGLGSKDTTPAQIIAVFDNLASWTAPKNRFTIGIVDDVTTPACRSTENFDTAPGGHDQLQVLGPWL
ncbi:MAG: hypothetical protein ACLVB5_15200 [Christensenellales bacterium]